MRVNKILFSVLERMLAMSLLFFFSSFVIVYVVKVGCLLTNLSRGVIIRIDFP